METLYGETVEEVSNQASIKEDLTMKKTVNIRGFSAEYKKRIKATNTSIYSNIKKVKDVQDKIQEEGVKEELLIGHDNQLIGAAEEEPDSDQNHGLIHVLTKNVVPIPTTNTETVHAQETVETVYKHYKIIAQKGCLPLFSKDIIKVGLNSKSDNDMAIRSLKSIGKGASGEVFLCQIIIDGNKYLKAVKKIIPTKNREEHIEAFATWKKYLPKLDNPYLLPPELLLQGDDDLMEIMQPGVMCLRKLLWELRVKHMQEDNCEKNFHFECNPMPILEILSMLANIFTGCEHLHKNKLLHGDIKPENIIVTSDGLKICDWGSLRDEVNDDQRVTGTPGFAAPEVYEKKSNCKSDVFSIGCGVIAEIVGLCPMIFEHDKKSKKDIVQDICHRNDMLGRLMSNTPRLLPYGIGEMFVWATKYDSKDRASIQDLILMNIRSLSLAHYHFYQQQQQQSLYGMEQMDIN